MYAHAWNEGVRMIDRATTFFEMSPNQNRYTRHVPMSLGHKFDINLGGHLNYGPNEKEGQTTWRKRYKESN